MKSLLLDKNYTYTVGDIAFFRRFYHDQPDERKAQIKELVSSGQLDMVHGGMVSPDEACPNYADVLRNFEMGHDFLWEEFGVRPRIGWQLDPFGHSAAYAEIYAQMGLETMVFSRIRTEDFMQRKAAKKL